jgi:hypothetical protein
MVKFDNSRPRRRSQWLSLLAMTVALGVTSLPSALAQEPIITDRPDYTESVETVPPGMTQIEGGYTFTQSDRHNNAQSLGELLIRTAIGSKSELRIGLNSYGVGHGENGSSYGLEDASLGAKIVLRKGAEGGGLRRPAVSLIALTTLPTGTEDERGSHFQPTVKLCLGYTLSPRIDLGVNANYSYVNDGDDRYGEFSPSASLGYALTDRVGSFFEYYSFHPFRDQPATYYLNTGMTYLLSDNAQLDVRVGSGLNGPSDDFFIGTGAAVRF